MSDMSDDAYLPGYPPFYYSRDHDHRGWCVRGPGGFYKPMDDKLDAAQLAQRLNSVPQTGVVSV